MSDSRGGVGDTRCLSVVIPVWNEEAGIRQTATELVEPLADLVERAVIGGFEVVFVDDGSTDATAPILDEVAAASSRCSVRHHTENRGVGAAIRTGVAAAQHPLVLYTDADLPIDVAEIDEALRLAGADPTVLVAAYRRRRAAEGIRRVVVSAVWNALVRRALGLALRDVNFAFKLAHRDALVAMNLQSNGPLIDVEILSRAVQSGLRVEQIPLTFQPRRSGRSSMSSLSVPWTMVRELIARRSELSVRRLTEVPLVTPAASDNSGRDADDLPNDG